MDDLTVSRNDIEELEQALDSASPPPAPDLLRAIVDAIQSTIGQDETVGVTVETDSVPDLFEAGFVGAGAASADKHIQITVAKVSRH